MEPQISITVIERDGRMEPVITVEPDPREPEIDRGEGDEWATR